MNIECLPQGICSGNYYLRGESISGAVRFNWGSERGDITINGVTYQIDKTGFFRSSWVLLWQGRPVCEARKPSAFSRRFELQHNGGPSVLQKEGFFGRRMRLTGAGGFCDIEPAHSFTRRAVISGQWNQGVEIAAFAFWLTSMMWQRDQNAAAAPASA